MIADVVEAGGQGLDDPDRPAVRDHQDFLAGMEPEDICKEVIHAGGEVLERLGIICPAALAGEPAPMRIGEALLDLLRRQAFPQPEAPLA